MSVQILRGNALTLPLDDNTVDLVVTSPPFFGLRSYQDGGQHYDGQLGSEATPAEFVDALIAATREMVRVVKPSGSIWVNLGDKYAGGGMGGHGGSSTLESAHTGGSSTTYARGTRPGVPSKSLIGVPWRYALRCIDDLGLILRAEVIWSKPNGLPESVTDRVRRSHETWFHFTLNPHYYSAVDEIREEHVALDHFKKYGRGPKSTKVDASRMDADRQDTQWLGEPNPLGKLPGSVWTIPTQPLTVPAELGVDHFAAFPMEWPRRIVTGWSPRDVCAVCGEGRRPVAQRDPIDPRFLASNSRQEHHERLTERGVSASSILRTGLQSGQSPATRVTGYACACPDTTAPATPGIVLDPFGGTGTTALVAHALGRHGISVDMSQDYCRLAEWRTSDPKELARAQQREYTPPREQVDGQETLFEGLGA
jgi:DNA modification methylase